MQNTKKPSAARDAGGVNPKLRMRLKVVDLKSALAWTAVIVRLKHELYYELRRLR
jgi:hypothetical protein